nr:bifunctional precorrin-2 dehydrogenase/sirohydrochlorin ferrochelatase [uncultured Cetobacterium sp.]
MESKKSFFPLFIDLNNKECLIVGGGTIALRKTKTLLDYGARVTVIAPEVSAEFYNLDVEIKKEIFKVGHIGNQFLVVAATDNENLNEMIVDLCEDKNIIVNNITSKTYMTARFSANIENDEYQIAISAKGEPKKSVQLKKELIKILGKEKKEN